MKLRGGVSPRSMRALSSTERKPGGLRNGDVHDRRGAQIAGDQLAAAARLGFVVGDRDQAEIGEAVGPAPAVHFDR